MLVFTEMTATSTMSFRFYRQVL